MSAVSSQTRQVRSVFKQLLRTRAEVFRGDDNALRVTRDKIKSEFLKHKTETDPAKLTELMKLAKESEEILRTKVVQLEAQAVTPNVYRIRKEHLVNVCINAKRERCADCTCGAFD